jgi:hypothetical protein
MRLAVVKDETHELMQLFFGRCECEVFWRIILLVCVDLAGLSHQVATALPAAFCSLAVMRVAYTVACLPAKCPCLQLPCGASNAEASEDVQQANLQMAGIRDMQVKRIPSTCDTTE